MVEAAANAAAGLMGREAVGTAIERLRHDPEIQRLEPKKPTAESRAGMAHTEVYSILHNLGLGEMQAKLRAMGLPQREADANRMGMLDIARPGGMGDFRVLVQGKGVGRPDLWGLLPSEAARTVVEGLPAPLRSPAHVPLMEGAYPHLGMDWGAPHR